MQQHQLPGVVSPTALSTTNLAEAQGAQSSEQSQPAQAGTDVSSVLAQLLSAGHIPGLGLPLGVVPDPVATTQSATLQAAPSTADQDHGQDESDSNVKAELIKTEPIKPDSVGAVKAEPNPSLSIYDTIDQGGVKTEEAQNGDAAAPFVDAAPVLAGDAGSAGAPDIGSNLFALLGQLAPGPARQ